MRAGKSACSGTSLRLINPADHSRVLAVVNDWWGGRDMACMLPRLFFTHFSNTSFVVEDEGRLLGFLIGFVSQSMPGEAYIHFAGVHPDYRNRGIAVRMYNHFFDVVREMGCRRVRCITSPVNTGSIAFHQRIGFSIETGDNALGGVAVTVNYDGQGGDRVCFTRLICE